MKTCCFTGHRPKALPWGSNEHCMECVILKHELFDLIEETMQSGYKRFIVGMAQGNDTYIAEILILLKSSHPYIIIEAAIPCMNQVEKWTKSARERYDDILALFDKQTVISKEYAPKCMQERNQYMVDQASLLIAVWNGKPSGTGNTVKYARNKGVDVMVLDIRSAKQ